MSVFDIFAKRKQREANAGKPVIYRHDVLPVPFRVQVGHIWRDAIGSPFDFKGPPLHDPTYIRKVQWWSEIHDTLAREIGVFHLVPIKGPFNEKDRMLHCFQFLGESKDVDQVLSIIEVSFKLIDTKVREFVLQEFSRWGFPPIGAMGISQLSDDVINDALQELSRRGIPALRAMGISQLPDDAIQELNHRFQEHAIGYQYQGGQIVRVDSLYLHSETVEPALSLLYDAKFEGALQEFLKAHKHYRERNNKEAIREAANAFESTLKTICDRRKWSYQKPTAAQLIKAVFDNRLIPAEMQNHFTSLQAVLGSGVPTIRNHHAGHGQGSNVVEIPDHLAAYALHLTASNIVFLVSAHNSH